MIVCSRRHGVLLTTSIQVQFHVRAHHSLLCRIHLAFFRSLGYISPLSRLWQFEFHLCSLLNVKIKSRDAKVLNMMKCRKFQTLHLCRASSIFPGSFFDHTLPLSMFGTTTWHPVQIAFRHPKCSDHWRLRVSSHRQAVIQTTLKLDSWVPSAPRRRLSYTTGKLADPDSLSLLHTSHPEISYHDLVFRLSIIVMT